MLREEASLSALFICWRNLVRHCRQQDAVHGSQSTVCWLPHLSGDMTGTAIAAAGLRNGASEEQQAGTTVRWHMMEHAAGSGVMSVTERATYEETCDISRNSGRGMPRRPLAGAGHHTSYHGSMHNAHMRSAGVAMPFQAIQTAAVQTIAPTCRLQGD